MAKSKGSLTRTDWVAGAPKMTRQGRSVHTKLSSTSRNGKRKAYRGQGK